MSKYTTEQLLEAISKHENVRDNLVLSNAMRIINGDLMFLQDAIINGDIILSGGFTGKHYFNEKAEYYIVEPNYEIITYLGEEIPKPLDSYPPLEAQYYCRNSMGIIDCEQWDNHNVDKRRFKYGIWTDEKHAEIAIELINKVLEINHEN